VSAAARDINSHWTTLSELDVSDLIDGTANTAVGDIVRLMGCRFSLGFITGDPNVVVGRFKYLRVRFVTVAGAPTIDQMDVTIVGYSRDSDTVTQTGTVSYTGLTSTSTTFNRDPNARYASFQAVMTYMQLDGVTNFTAYLQGSLDGSNWITMAAGMVFTVDVPVGGVTQSLFGIYQGRFSVDMDPYKYFRVAVVRLGAAGANTNFTLSFYMVHDAYDAAYQQSTISNISPDLAGVFYRVVFGVYTDAGGHVGTLNGQILDLNNRPIFNTLPVRLVVFDAANRYAADMALSVTATITGATVGTALYPAAGPWVNTLLLETDGSGNFTVQLTEVGANDVVVAAVPYVPTTVLTDANFVGSITNHNFSPLGLTLISSEQKFCAIL
jgi:hypothetical protein